MPDNTTDQTPATSADVAESAARMTDRHGASLDKLGASACDHRLAYYTSYGDGSTMRCVQCDIVIARPDAERYASVQVLRRME